MLPSFCHQIPVDEQASAPSASKYLMRHFSLLAALTWALLNPAVAAPAVRIATSDTDGWEAGPGETSLSDSDLRRLRQTAASLKQIEADILILHGIPDPQTARRLASLLKPASYSVALHTVFRANGTNGPVIGPSISILSRRQPSLARAMDWRATGQIDLPGGFAFASFTSATNTLCIYAVHLPDETALESSAAPAVRKRELAAQYLAHHANWLVATLTNQPPSFFVAGDFVVTSATTENAVRILQRAGFKDAGTSSSAKPRPSSGPGADPTFATLLVRNADFRPAPRAPTGQSASLAPVVYDLTPRLTPPPTTPVAAQRIASTTPGVNPWPWFVGGAALVSVVVLGILISRLRRRTKSLAVTFQPARAKESAAVESTGAAHWQSRAARAEQRAEQAQTVIRAGLLPRLTELMRERLIAWLSAQRSGLIASHQAGTEQMVELEERLQRLQGHFHGQLQTRDERIASLEQEIAAKERLIEELLRAQAQLDTSGHRG